MCGLTFIFFFFSSRRRHTRSLCDWSSDVCSSDLVWQVDQARERARAADAALARGERWGPLHGISMTVKESFNVAGLPTRSEERRVGKEGRSRLAGYQAKEYKKSRRNVTYRVHG